MPEEVERLEVEPDFGKEEAIYPTVAGAPGALLWSIYLSKIANIYLFQFGRPTMPIPLKGLRSKVKKISVLATGQELSYRFMGGAPWLNIPGVLWIDLPREYCDPVATVLKIELAEELDLYREEGQTITHNE